MKTKLLFICTANINRSRAAEDLFVGSNKYEAKSAGIIKHKLGGQAVRQELINWADIIFVMDEINDRHLTKLCVGFDVGDKIVFVLDIPDKFGRREGILSAMLREKLAGHGVEV